MADIQLDGLASLLRRRFHMEGAGLTRFENDLLAAINMARARITVDCDLETRIPAVSSLTGSIALDDIYFDILVDVASLNLCDLGQRPAQGDEFNIAQARASLPTRIDRIRSDLMNQAQAADTDDTTSRVGLGALGA